MESKSLFKVFINNKNINKFYIIKGIINPLKTTVSINPSIAVYILDNAWNVSEYTSSLDALSYT